MRILQAIFDTAWLRLTIHHVVFVGEIYAMQGASLSSFTTLVVSRSGFMVTKVVVAYQQRNGFHVGVEPES